jgi:hypothetical protein
VIITTKGDTAIIISLLAKAKMSPAQISNVKYWLSSDYEVRAQRVIEYLEAMPEKGKA